MSTENRGNWQLNWVHAVVAVLACIAGVVGTFFFIPSREERSEGIRFCETLTFSEEYQKHAKISMQFYTELMGLPQAHRAPLISSRSVEIHNAHGRIFEIFDQAALNFLEYPGARKPLKTCMRAPFEGACRLWVEIYQNDPSEAERAKRAFPSLHKVLSGNDFWESRRPDACARV
jgi:hypothetical protein